MFPFFSPFPLEHKSPLRMLTGALKHTQIHPKVHISVIAPNGTHPSIRTPTFCHADTFRRPPRRQTTRDTRPLHIQKNGRTILVQKHTEIKLFVFPNRQCMLLLELRQPFELRAKTGNREESDWLVQSSFCFACFLL